MKICSPDRQDRFHIVRSNDKAAMIDLVKKLKNDRSLSLFFHALGITVKEKGK